MLNEVDKDFKPEGFIHIFMNHPLKLIEFLEFIITESKSIIGSDGQSLEVPFEISNTLLEMYLYSYKNEIKEDVRVFQILNCIFFNLNYYRV